MKELKPRVKDGVESDTHFLYTDKKGREWSVVNFEKMMGTSPLTLSGEKYSSMFDYNWEGMYFPAEGENEQFRGMTAEEVIKQIDE